MNNSVKAYVADLINGLPHGQASALALHCDVSPAQVSKWKQAQNAPMADKWPLIETYFELDQGTLAGLSQGGQGLSDRLDRLERVVDRVQEEIDAIRRVLPPPAP